MRPALLGGFRSSPGVVAAVLALVTLAIVFWRSESGPARHVARLSNLQATLDDGAACEFSADVELAGRWARIAFGVRQSAVRTALIDVVRTRSRYMVSSGPARESMRAEMLRAVNGLIGSGQATAVWLLDFELR